MNTANKRTDAAAPELPVNAPTFIDICFNLTHASFRKDEAEVLIRARAAGINAMVVPGSSLADSTDAVTLAQHHPDLLFPTAGTHPHLASDWHDDSREQLHALIRRHAVVAVGECGLDYYRDFSPRARQLRAFEEQVEVSAETGLPLFLHQRDAHDDFIGVLRQSKAGNGVVHCFTGNRGELEAYLELGLHIGITGWLCDERRGAHLEELVAAIPDERLLLETDAPYLLPRDLSPAVRPRDRRNEPAFVAHIGARVAACRGVPVTQIAHTTSANARRLFGLTA